LFSKPVLIEINIIKIKRSNGIKACCYIAYGLAKGYPLPDRDWETEALLNLQIALLI